MAHAIRPRPCQNPDVPRPPHLLVMVVGLLLAGLASAPGASGDGGAAPNPAPGPAPQQNFSDLHSAEEWVLTAIRDAERATSGGRLAEASRLYQSIVDAVVRTGSPREAAPYVLPIHGTASYEGAFLVARHRIGAAGAALLGAYTTEYGATALRLLDRAISAADRDSLADVATRFLPLPSGRRAALLLADLALEAGDPDEALEWCQALEDLEATSNEGEDALAPWREARIDRHARALARLPADVETVRAGLARRAARRTAPDRGITALPLGAVTAPPTATAWTTTGGHASRAGVAPDIAPTLELAWVLAPSDGGKPLADSADPADFGPRAPSTFLPPRAVVVPEFGGSGLALVSDGFALRGFDLKDGRRRFEYPFQGVVEHGQDTPIDRRNRTGWIEGHALSVEATRTPDGRPAWLVFAAVPDGRPFFALGEEREERYDHVEAFLLTGQGLEPLWAAGGGLGEVDDDGPDSHPRLYGAPLLYRGLVWMAGVLPAATSRDRVESWLVALDPWTGAVRRRTHVGSGTAVRPGREDELMPTAPAAAAGRIVFGTALGLVVAVSARDGRVLWAWRYDRDVEVDRASRGRRRADTLEPRSIGFANEPPRLALERCAIAPTDGHDVLVFFDRPIGPERELLSLAIDRRRDHVDFHPESIVGLVPGTGTDVAPWLVTVGQGLDTGEVPGPLAVARDLVTGRVVWQAMAGLALGTRPYGDALLTANELLVPTREGIVRFRRDDGRRVALHAGDAVPAAAAWDEPTLPYGNLVPIPGGGVLAVSATTIACWRPRP